MMDHDNGIVAQNLDTRYQSRESKNQDKEGILEDKKPLILFNSNGVKTSTNAQNAQVE